MGMRQRTKKAWEKSSSRSCSELISAREDHNQRRNEVRAKEGQSRQIEKLIELQSSIQLVRVLMKRKIHVLISHGDDAILLK